jgi:hypothetical protein
MKTHFLSLISNLALERDPVVSMEVEVQLPASPRPEVKDFSDLLDGV